MIEDDRRDTQHLPLASMACVCVCVISPVYNLINGVPAHTGTLSSGFLSVSTGLASFLKSLNKFLASTYLQVYLYSSLILHCLQDMEAQLPIS